MGNPLTATSLAEWAVDQRDMAPHIAMLTYYAGDALIIVEFGVRGAVSTWAFLDGLPAGGRMWSVDIDDCHVPPRVSSDPRWTFIRGDDMSDEARAQLPKVADLVFIDTSHEYEHTKAELDFASALRPSRIICHDADWPGVTQAIHEFCERTKWRVVNFVEAGDERGMFSLAVLEQK